MKTLIIPCAGGRKIRNYPLYLNRHPSGDIVLHHALAGLDISVYDRIVVTITKLDDIQYHASDVIISGMTCIPRMEVCVLGDETSGVADTVYYTIIKMNILGNIVIKDVTNSIVVPQIYSDNFIVGLNLSTFKRDVHDLRNKSYISINDQRQVLDIIEKQISSEHIGVGLYGLNVDDFIMAYKRLKDENYDIKRLYISHIIAYLMGYSDRIFHYIEAQDFESWSDEKSWGEVQTKYATYFIDFDSIIKNSAFSSEYFKKVISNLSEEGAMLVVFSSLTSNEVSDYLDGELPSFQKTFFLYECNYSVDKQIISSLDNLSEKYSRLF